MASQQRLQARLPQSALRKLEKWRSLPHEKKVEKLREALEYFKKVAERDGALVASLKFAKWAMTEDGAIMIPWMWREEYRPLMTEIVYTAVEIVAKMFGVKSR